MVKSKICIKCGKRKLLSGFYKNKSRKDGFRSGCKKCWKKYRQSEKGKQIQNKADKKYRQTLKGYLYGRFYAMKYRCNNPKCECYKNYGGRGIKVKFKNTNEFVDYVINELKTDPRGLTIDRIDNDGHYEKGNIRFVTHKENCNNRKRK